MQSKENDIYLKIRGEINGKLEEILTVGKLAEVVANDHWQPEVERIPIITIQAHMDEFLVVSALDLVRGIKRKFPQANLIILGDEEILVKVNLSQQKEHKPSLLLVTAVCFLLFIGSALAIMNFHADVDMGRAHQEIYRILTGKRNPHPLLLQIPYSIGIGLGMAVFFGFISKKSREKDPSPLELEVYSYEQNIHGYVLNKKQKKEKDEEK